MHLVRQNSDDRDHASNNIKFMNSNLMMTLSSLITTISSQTALHIVNGHQHVLLTFNVL